MDEMISGKKGPDRPKASGYKCGPLTYLHGSCKGSARAPGRQPRAKPGMGAQPAACQVIQGAGRLTYTAGSLLPLTLPGPTKPLPGDGEPSARPSMGELEEGQAAPSGRILALLACPSLWLLDRVGSGLVVHRITENQGIN